MEEVLIKCPNCGHEFNAQEALASDVEKRLQEQFQQKLKEETEKIKSKESDLLAREKEFEEKRRNENELFQQKVQKEMLVRQEQLRTQIQQETEEKYSSMLTEKAASDKRLKELESKALDVEKQKQDMANLKEQLELDMRKVLLAKESEIREQAKKLAEDRAQVMMEDEIRKQKFAQEQRDIELESKLKRMFAADKEEALRMAEKQRQMDMADLNRKLEEQKRLADEMQRKANQGSMQTQGEIGELDVEVQLRNLFPDDVLHEVPKGITGADCILEVRNNLRLPCGKIVFESKRTKAFSDAWVHKLKEDTLRVQGDIAVLVTETLPLTMVQMGLHDGIWICRFTEVAPLVTALRHGLLELQLVKANQENKGDKMNLLYDYLTGSEFRQTVEAIVESFSNMKTQLEKEKRQFTKIWAERDKQIERMMNNTLRMHGSIRGIAGNSIQDINLLEEGTEIDEE